jgi:hypothetical protein
MTASDHRLPFRSRGRLVSHEDTTRPLQATALRELGKPNQTLDASRH